MNQRHIIFFGAGVSGESGMPLGNALATHWLSHLLPAGVADDIHTLFRKAARITGKDSPRLELVVGEAVKVFGPECLNLLSFFRHCQPNRFHRLIANYMVQEKTWAFTTNFDKGIESSAAVPVHQGGTLGPENWGLVKLHGCMDQPLSSLGVTIENIQQGLPPSYAGLLQSLLQDEGNTFVFVGYSGTDYFDVVRFFMKPDLVPHILQFVRVDGQLCGFQREDDMHQNARTVKAYARWIAHGTGEEGEEARLTEGADLMLCPFLDDRCETVYGKSYEITASLLGIEAEKEDWLPERWDREWASVFTGSREQKRLYAARLFTCFGVGQKVLQALAPQPLTPEETRLWANALRDTGRYDDERAFREDNQVWGTNPTEIRRQKAMLARLSGRKLEALARYVMILVRYRSAADFFQADDPPQAIRSVLEAGLYFDQLSKKFRHRSWIMAPLILISYPICFLQILALQAFRLVEAHPESSAPHFQAMYHRLAASLNAWQGRLMEFFDIWFFDNDLPTPELSKLDQTGAAYLETDSLLGVVNNSRASAETWMDDFHWSVTGSFSPESDAVTYCVQELENSRDLAEMIGDREGARKANALLDYLSRKMEKRPAWEVE